MNRLLQAFLVFALLALGPVSAQPQTQEERITNFKSDVVINADSTMNVEEEIEVYVAGEEIKRGILRDFPTTYEDDANNTIRVAFNVVSVLRNGQPEPYSLENITNGVRVRIGDANVMLTPGIHRYTITYETDRQLGFFEEFDELYWNATGNGWNLAIDRAEGRAV